MIYRALILSVSAFFQVCIANAAGCDHLLSEKSFAARGGVLKPLTHLRERDGFVMLECADAGVACNGGVVVRGVIARDGVPTNLRIAGSNFSFHPEQNEAAALHIAGTMRYLPPHLNGEPVCVLHDWSYATQVLP